MTADLPRQATPEDILSLVRYASIPFFGMFATPENSELFRIALRKLAVERNLDFEPSEARFVYGVVYGTEHDNVFVTESGIEHSFKLFSWPPYIAPLNAQPNS